MAASHFVYNVHNTDHCNKATAKVQVGNWNERLTFRFYTSSDCCYPRFFALSFCHIVFRSIRIVFLYVWVFLPLYWMSFGLFCFLLHLFSILRCHFLSFRWKSHKIYLLITLWKFLTNTEGTDLFRCWKTVGNSGALYYTLLMSKKRSLLSNFTKMRDPMYPMWTNHDKRSNTLTSSAGMQRYSYRPAKMTAFQLRNWEDYGFFCYGHKSRAPTMDTVLEEDSARNFVLSVNGILFLNYHRSRISVWLLMKKRGCYRLTNLSTCIISHVRAGRIFGQLRPIYSGDCKYLNYFGLQDGFFENILKHM